MKILTFSVFFSLNPKHREFHHRQLITNAYSHERNRKYEHWLNWRALKYAIIRHPETNKSESW